MAKILIAKIGLDGHDRGALLVARELKEAGHEAIYSGLHRTPEEIAIMSAEEDVDLIAVGILSGAHMALIPILIEELKQRQVNKPITFGGIITKKESESLKNMGIKAVFNPGTPLKDIVKKIEEIINE
ncbi:methylmalonyl-CoA mutase [bacterium]|nr:methylmalonyl-CoA mutase [bacterium]|tara:strand:+ start:41722 stop:42105 length:384 start_codon:yes stop_codon:yes gene_type:complete